MLFEPNYAGVDDLLEQAIARRGLPGALREHLGERAVTLAELMEDVSWSSAGESDHYGRVARQLAAFVYVVCAYGGARYGGKSIWGVDVWRPPAPGGRTAFLAVAANGAYPEAPVLVPMPELPPVLRSGNGTVLDSRAALHALIRRIIDSANAVRPAADFLAAQVPVQQDAEELRGDLTGG